MYILRYQAMRYYSELAVLLMGTISFVLMKDVAFIGDEVAYAKASNAIVDFLSGDITWTSFKNNIVAHGWFMPGMSVLLSPVMAIFGGSSYELAFSRLWAVLLNCVLLIFIFREIDKLYDSRFTHKAFLIAMLAPFCVLFMSCIWGDLISCLLMMYIALRLSNERIFSRLSSAVNIGVLLSVAIYIRGSYSAFIVLVLFLVVLNVKEGRQLFRKSLSTVISMTVAIALVFPWSVMVSQHTKIPTFTITSLKLTQIIGIGEPSYWHQLSREGGQNNRFLSVDKAIRDRAIENEVSVREQYSFALKESLSLITLPKYKERVARNIRHYVSKPSGFISSFKRNSCADSGWLCRIEDATNDSLQFWNHWFSLVVFAMALLLMVTPFKKMENVLISVYFKGAFFLYLIQPLFAASHVRYMVQLFPLVSLSACVLIAERKLLFKNIGFDVSNAQSIIISIGQLFALIVPAIYLWAYFL